MNKIIKNKYSLWISFAVTFLVGLCVGILIHFWWVMPSYIEHSHDYVRADNHKKNSLHDHPLNRRYIIQFMEKENLSDQQRKMMKDALYSFRNDVSIIMEDTRKKNRTIFDEKIERLNEELEQFLDDSQWKAWQTKVRKLRNHLSSHRDSLEKKKRSRHWQN